MSRINIPKNPDQFVTLCKGIVAKHAQDGANSPLAGLDMADMLAKTNEADTQNQLSAKLYRDAEQATQNRDLAIGADTPVKGTLTFYVRATRDILGGLYKGNEQKLGDWTFDVNNSTQANSTATPATAPKP